jgi:hypothetical protein
MEEARTLIAAFRELNETEDRKVAIFTASLISLFGSTGMFNDFLNEMDAALVSGKVPEAVRTRAANLTNTYIPQVAGLNSIQNLDAEDVSADALRSIRNDSAVNRKQGARVILASLVRILKAVYQIG